MVTINKKLAQLERIKEEIALEKQRIEQDIGKELIAVLELDYDKLTKKEIKAIANQLKESYDKNTSVSPFNN